MRHLTIVKLFMLALMLSGLHTLPVTAKNVSVLEFGAKPDDGKDDTRALRKAAEYCRHHPGTTLTVPPGTYRLRDATAEQLEQQVLSGKMGGDPEK